MKMKQAQARSFQSQRPKSAHRLPSALLSVGTALLATGWLLLLFYGAFDSVAVCYGGLLLMMLAARRFQHLLHQTAAQNNDRNPRR
jgi:hypothetical protein